LKVGLFLPESPRTGGGVSCRRGGGLSRWFISELNRESKRLGSFEARIENSGGGAVANGQANVGQSFRRGIPALVAKKGGGGLGAPRGQGGTRKGERSSEEGPNSLPRLRRKKGKVERIHG